MTNWTKPEAYLPHRPKQSRLRRLNLRVGNDWPLAFLIGSVLYLAI